MRVSIVAIAVLLGGCHDDLRPVTASWTEQSKQWHGKVEALKNDDTAQAQKISGLCATEGLDPASSAAKACAELKVTSQSDKAGLDGLGAALARHKAGVDQALARGKRLEVAVAIDAANAEIPLLIARVADDAQLRKEAGRGLEAAVTEEFEIARAAAITAEARALTWKQAAVDRTPLELTAIRFQKDAAALEPGAQNELQELVTWASSCAGLTFSITAHGAAQPQTQMEQRLTDARAAAVKKFLVDNGVAATRILSATGIGARKPIAAEPEAAAALSPEALERLRTANHRVTIQAVSVCPMGERAELPQR